MTVAIQSADKHFTPAGPDSFRDAMSRLGAAVNIVTSDGPAGLAGCTATAVCSVSDSPPTLLVCINRASRNNRILRENGRLCVNILSGEHENIARRFADAGLAIEQRFEHGDWLTTGAAPALADAAASLQCEITQIAEIGTHSTFFCSVREIRISEERGALIYLGRHFHCVPKGTT